MKKIVLITGASGFFGKNLIKFLPKENYNYHLILRKKIKKLDKKIFKQIIVKDIFNKKKIFWNKYLHNVNIVIHLAWILNKNFYNSKMNKKCYLGTLELAKACSENLVQRFISIGSCAEYFWNNKIITTKSKLKSKTNYSRYKTLTSKKLNSLFYKKIEFVWLRPFFVFGKYQKKHQLYPSIMSKLKKKNKIIIFNSKNEYDFVLIEFLCNFLVRVIQKSKPRKTYNICTGKPVSVKKFLLAISKKNHDLFDFRQMNKKLRVFGKKEKI